MQLGRCCKCREPHVFNRYMRVVGPIAGGERTIDTTEWDAVTASPSGTTTFTMPAATYGTTTSMVPMRYALTATTTRSPSFELGAVRTSPTSAPYLLDIGARDTLIPLNSHWLSECEVSAIEFRPYLFGSLFIWNSFNIGPPNAVAESACVVTGYRIWIDDEDVTGIVDRYDRIEEAKDSTHRAASLIRHTFTEKVPVTEESTVLIDVWYERDFNTRYVNAAMLARCIDFGYASFDDYCRNYAYAYVVEIQVPYLFRLASNHSYTGVVTGTPPTAPTFALRYHTAITCHTRYRKPVKIAMWIFELESGYSVTLGGLTTIHAPTESGWTWTNNGGVLTGNISGDRIRLQYGSEVPEIAIRWAAGGTPGKWAIYVPGDSTDYVGIGASYARGVWSNPTGSSTFVLRGRMDDSKSGLIPDPYSQFPPTITLTRV